ncbi:5'-nucleotidase SurE [Spirochaetia bacterium]|nr:5'-nucleotidase SurE [Spirochaetia bacterium]
MNILCTNDDGYDSAGIKELAAALRAAGHRVVILAPDRERSGSSHSLGMVSNATYIKNVDGAPDDWICTGTPADCVLSVVSGGLNFHPDAVASGINAGGNLGTDIVFSGTAGAARQAALCSLPGIAFSLDTNGPFDFKPAAKWAANNFENLVAALKKANADYCANVLSPAQKWKHLELFYNINFPPTSDFESEPLITFPCKRRYFDCCKQVDADDGWKLLNFSEMQLETNATKGSDADAVAKNRISLSAIKVAPDSFIK